LNIIADAPIASVEGELVAKDILSAGTVIPFSASKADTGSNIELEPFSHAEPIAVDCTTVVKRMLLVTNCVASWPATRPACTAPARVCSADKTSVTCLTVKAKRPTLSTFESAWTHRDDVDDRPAIEGLFVMEMTRADVQLLIAAGVS
jgi:hypothetical protein